MAWNRLPKQPVCASEYQCGTHVDRVRDIYRSGLDYRVAATVSWWGETTMRVDDTLQQESRHNDE